MLMSVTIVEKPGAGVAVIRLNRPEVRNAINMAMRRELVQNVRALVEDREVRCIVVTGNEQAFAGGADVSELSEMRSVDHVLQDANRVWITLSECPKPMIAAVNGFALGGGMEVAMAADIIVAGEGARFAHPEILLGILPGGGGTQRVVRAVGKYQAMKMVLTGEMVSAAEALRMGLVSEVVPDSEVFARAIELAEKIAALSPLAVLQAKELVLAAGNVPLDAGLMLERKGYQLLYETEDQKEGMRAFLEKRKPRFKGK